MRFSGLNTNRDRAAFWRRVRDEYGPDGLGKALDAIDPVSAKVLTWHYLDGHSLHEITRKLNRSISTIRNHHSRGMFELQQYYLNQEKALL